MFKVHSCDENSCNYFVQKSIRTYFAVLLNVIAKLPSEFLKML